MAMAEGPQKALALVSALDAESGLENYYLLHAVRADLLRRIRSLEEAAESYKRALALVTNDAERRFLERRLQEVQSMIQRPV
jgi:RNA polymerase sigma-70 factor (ECF subfamily)